MQFLKPCLNSALLFFALSACADPLPEIIEGMPPTYRKISLVGRHFPGPMPQDRDNSDSEPEQTFVDAMTLQLQHRTTDVYDSIGSAELAITVNRSSEDAVWTEGEGLSPAQRPDLPFGNCWSSGLAANVHFIDRGEKFPGEAIVSDEEGTTHRFVISGVKGKRVFIHLPHSRSQQDFQMTSLTRLKSGKLIFTKKFGIQLKFESSPSVKITTQTKGIKERHSYHRTSKISDRFGATINYRYEKNNTGLIPDQIAYQDQIVSFHRNTEGCISRIVDPSGFIRLYDYREPKQPGGAPLMLNYRKPITGSARAKTRHDYDECTSSTPEGTKIHYCSISLIASREDRAYQFKYSRKPTQCSYRTGRNIESVILPGEFGEVQFIPHSTLSDKSGNIQRRTFVKNPEGNGIFYEFTENRIETITADGKPLARVAMYANQTTTYFQGNQYTAEKAVKAIGDSVISGVEKYSFDTSSGGMVSEAIDISGNAVSFAYQDVNPALKPGDGIIHPMAVHLADPTTFTLPLGEQTSYSYSKKYRLPIKIIDPVGRITIHKVATPSEVVVSTRVYANQDDFNDDRPFSQTDSEFKNETHPGFTTRRIKRKTSGPPETIPWEVDLVTAYIPDKRCRTEKIIEDPDDLGYFTRRIYDDNGNLRSKVFTNGYQIDFKYDAMNRVTSIFQPSNSGPPVTKRNIYNLTGDLIRKYEEDGTVHVFEYDNMRHKSRQVTYAQGDYPDKPGKTTESTFDSSGSTIAGTDENGNKYTIEFDGLDRATLIKYANGTQINYRYEKNCGDNLFSSSGFEATAKESTRDDFITISEFNKSGQNIAKVKKSKSDDNIISSEAYRFNAANNHVKTILSTGTTEFVYDPLDRLIRTNLSDGRHSKILYTSTGLKYATVEPNGKRSEQEFDAAGELVEQ